jgi:hypothetical protein
MEPTILNYKNCIIEIHEHPIYHDFEYVIKSKDGKKVMGSSTQPYEIFEDAEVNAKMTINML